MHPAFNYSFGHWCNIYPLTVEWENQSIFEEGEVPLQMTIKHYFLKDVFNINGAILILIVFFSFAFVYLVIYKFPQMKNLLRREHYNGLYPIYLVYSAEVVSGLPFNVIMPLIFSS